MRSLLLALAFAAPVSAVAATPASIPTPSYTNALHAAHPLREQKVFLTLVNRTFQDREVRVGDGVYDVRWGRPVNVFVPVGSVVRVYSDQNSKVNGQELLRVSANDKDKSVYLK